MKSKTLLFISFLLLGNLLYAQNWETLIYDNFEEGWYWQSGDDNSVDGRDYWGRNSGVGDNSNHSSHCAYYKDGSASGTLTYDNNMQAWLKRTFDCGSYNDLRITFSYYVNTASNDLVSLESNGTRVWYLSGDSRDWQTETVYLTEFAGNSSVELVFWFKSDGITIGEGAYIDDVRLEYKQAQTTFPDLIVEDIWTDPANPQVGQDVEMHCRIKNIGDGPAEDITVRYYLDGLYVDKDKHRTLNPGVTQEEHDPAPPFVTTGSHDYQVWIDHLDNESNTSNNKRQESISVGSQSAVPDLIVDDIWTVPATPKVGEPAQMYCRIKNIGSADADDITVRYYINQQYQGKDSHDKLAPGATQQENEPFTFSYAADFAYEVRTDKLNGETNTENSKLNKTITVEPAGETNNPPVVSNVRFKQRDDNSFMVDIYYDLHDPDGDLLTTEMQVSDDDGISYGFKCDNTKGHIGAGIVPGTNKHIEWDFDAEHPNTIGDNFRIKIIADDNYSGGETGTMTDQDGNVYKTLKIGDQWWMAENLKVTHYRNGDAIPNVTDNSEWAGLSTGAWCAYNNDNGIVPTYGLLYNWYAMDDSRNIAPTGWHVPTDEEWKQLEMYLGMSQSEADDYDWRGTDEGGKLKETGTAHWNSPNKGATNESGFTALPGGYRNYSDGAYYPVGGRGYWWSATEYSFTNAWARRLYYDRSDVSRSSGNKHYGFSLRCIRD